MKKFDKNYISKNSFWPEGNRSSYHCFNKNDGMEGVVIWKVVSSSIFTCKNGNSYGVDIVFKY